MVRIGSTANACALTALIGKLIGRTHLSKLEGRIANCDFIISQRHLRRIDDETIQSSSSRNSLCSCGSEKKYKHCHGRSALGSVKCIGATSAFANCHFLLTNFRKRMYLVLFGNPADGSEFGVYGLSCQHEHDKRG